MERDFEFQKLIAGGEVYGIGGISPAISVEEAYINGVYNGILSFQSLLNAANEPPSLLYNACYANEASLYDAYYQMPALEPAPASPSPITYSFLGEKFPATATENFNDVQKLKMPKLEIFNAGDARTEPFNLFAETNEFPSLDSLTESAGNSVMQKLKFETGGTRTPYKSWSPSSAAARRRRQTISEKARSLEKLLPWDKKMDMARMLEEAYKYVKFLEAQISVLQSMPVDASLASFSTLSSVDDDAASPSVEVLKKLNRQQLLEIVVNSRVAQARLSSKGLCVYSVEQLLWLNNGTETRLLFPCYSI